MKKMREELTIQETLHRLNTEIRRNLWCDFEVWSLIGDELIIMGGITLTYYFTVKITFVNVAYLQIVQSWSSDTNENVIELPSTEEQRTINLGYEIEQGYIMFRINAENKLPIYVSAQNITVSFEKVERSMQ